MALIDKGFVSLHFLALIYTWRRLTHDTPYQKLRDGQRVSIVQPITDPKKYKKLTSDPSFKSRKIFSENLVAIHLLMQIQTDDINADLIDMADQFDFSNYPVDHPVRQTLDEKKIKANKKTSGLFKDECNGAMIVEFIGLRPKMYSIFKADD